MNIQSLLKTLGAGLCLLAAGSAQATLLDFDLDWSGAPKGNSATASGTITIDDTILVNPGINDTSFVTAFSITVSGTSGGAGDGTWGLADFSDIILEVDTALDLSTELIGQTVLGGTWGMGGECCGDFNIFRVSSSSAPEGTDFFEITPSGTTESLLLTSFRPAAAAPAPSSLALLGIGIAALRRRRESA